MGIRLLSIALTLTTGLATVALPAERLVPVQKIWLCNPVGCSEHFWGNHKVEQHLNIETLPVVYTVSEVDQLITKLRSDKDTQIAQLAESVRILAAENDRIKKRLESLEIVGADIFGGESKRGQIKR